MEVFELKSKGLRRQSSSEPTTWGKMSCLLMTALAAFFVCFALFFFNYIVGHKKPSEEIEFLQTASKESSYLDTRCESNYCDTKSCVASASRILDIVDPSADPCQDFYQYACGGYGKTRAVRYNEDYYSPVKEAMSDIRISIKKLMEIPSTDGESQILRKTKAFYESCLNTSQRSDLQLETLNAWFCEIQLSLKDSNSENILDPGNFGSWRRLLAKLEEYQIHTVLKPEFKPSEDEQIGILEIDCLAPMLVPDTYLKPREVGNAYLLSMYREVMDGALRILSFDKHERVEFIEGIIELETTVARAIQRYPTPNVPPLSVEHKQQIQEIWRPLVGNGISNLEIISTCGNNLQHILSALNQANPRTSFNYIIWRLLAQIMQYQGSNLRDLHVHYLGRLPGVDDVWRSKWMQCADVVRTELGLVAVKGLMDEGYVTQAQISDVKEMFWELKRSFAQVFRSMPWLDDTTRELFLEKIKGVKLVIGYPEIINTTGILDAVYEGLEVESNYFLNVMNLKFFKTRYYYRRLWHGNSDDPVSQISLRHSPLDSMTNYDYMTNTVNIDLGLLRSPLYRFGEDFPNYLKYGQALSLAHALSHAFDSTGNFYDGYGNKMDHNWWPTEVGEKFAGLAICLTTQNLEFARGYSKPIPAINRTETLNNNLADSASFFITFAGLTSHLHSYGEEEKPLPGITLNKKQTYYVQAAQTFCELREKSSSYSEAKFILPAKYRLNTAVSNTEDFGNVFQCALGTPMNPEAKCNVLH